MVQEHSSILRIYEDNKQRTDEKTIMKPKRRRTIENKHKITTYKLAISCFNRSFDVRAPYDDPTGIETLVGIL